MGMQKLDFIRRQPGITDFNMLVEKINEIISKLDTKIEIEEVAISRQVKDFTFFKGEETKLPYHIEYTITSNEDATKVFELYNFSYKEIKQINDIIIKWNIVALTIDVTEEITEKEKKQEIFLGYVKTVDLDAPAKETPKKRGRKPKKKTSWN